uniref:Spindle pole body component 110 n=2 Tax=Anthurium amnicola TaxID=1678845 RepID=A0A1D1Z5X0_9ARAE
MSQGGGGGASGRDGGGPKRKTGPNRGGFQGGRGNGQTIMMARQWRPHPKCINASNPYHDCSDYCYQRVGENPGATKQDSQSSNPTAATTLLSSGIKTKSSNTGAGQNNEDMQRKGLEAAASNTTAAAAAESATTTKTETTLENIEPVKSRTIVREKGESNEDRQIPTQPVPTCLPECPPTMILEDVKPKSSALAAEPFGQEHEQAVAAQMVQSTGLIELEGLEEEVRKQRDARALRKRRKIEISYPFNGEDTVEELEYKLTLKLLGYERLGYLTRVENEEDDESLVQFGDKFGLAVLNEYPKFFIQVPQHPHYRGTSLNKVKREMAENFWDMLVPLIRRGISAVRENKETEITAVEQMITRLRAEGFDLKHLQAYINTSRRARANRSFLKGEFEKVKSQIETEEKEIDDVISSKPMSEVIKELEANKAMYQNFIDKLLSDIDASLAKARRLLDKEKVIRDTKTTPEHTALLKLKDHLERKLRDANNEAWMLLLD